MSELPRKLSRCEGRERLVRNRKVEVQCGNVAGQSRNMWYSQWTMTVSRMEEDHCSLNNHELEVCGDKYNKKNSKTVFQKSYMTLMANHFIICLCITISFSGLAHGILAFVLLNF